VLAENEDAVADVGWQPFSVDQGFAAGENVVTVQSSIAVTVPTYTSGRVAENHLNIISELIGHTFRYRAYLTIRDGKFVPLIVMTPSVAQALAGDGYNKGDVRKYLYENTKMKASSIEKYARNTAANNYSLKEFVETGMIPSEYYESDDPDRMLRIFL